jgi:membrane associated rhomboid family serine protease
MVIAPWNKQDAFPAPPEDSEYGWWDKDQARKTNREGLEEQCSGGDNAAPILVWTPDSDGMVTDRDVDFLRAAVRARQRRAAKRKLGAAVFCFVLCSALMAMQLNLNINAWTGPLFMWVLFGVFPLASVWRERRLLSRELTMTVEEREDARFTVWLSRAKARVTYIALALVGVVAFVVMIVGMDVAIARAGLVKQPFWSGEWWRALTGPWLHLSIMHLMFNFSALFALGRVVEAVFGWRWLMVVLAASMLAGAAASACWLDKTSVGYSGAILGLLGFQIGVLGKRSELLPSGSRKSGLMSLGLVTLLGVLGFEFIDNAAHLGGALAGAGLGWWAGSKSGADATRLREPSWGITVPAGMVVVGSAGWTVCALVGW